MFRIGEFAQIARVSGRQLRHYDRLGLLRPLHVDPYTGYRYYGARQLPRLNRLLALKALAFSLDQVAKMLDDDVPPEELRGMLAIRKAQVEQSLAEEQAKLRQIESRILQIEEQGALRDYDVVIRQEPAHPFLAVRHLCPDLGEAVNLVHLVVQRGRQLKARDKLTIVVHSDFEDEALDLEVGFTLTRAVNTALRLPGDLTTSLRELEPVDTMASIVRTGPNDQSHLAYGALGVWMEADGYQIAGLCREVFLELPFAGPAKDDVVMEIQFPVQKAA